MDIIKANWLSGSNDEPRFGTSIKLPLRGSVQGSVLTLSKCVAVYPARSEGSQPMAIGSYTLVTLRSNFYEIPDRR